MSEKNEKFYMMGTTFSIVVTGTPVQEKLTIMLTQYHDQEFVFQLICIDGYYKGYIEGYIKKDKKAEKLKVIGVTKEHLMKELDRVVEYKKKSFKWVDKHYTTTKKTRKLRKLIDGE